MTGPDTVSRDDVRPSQIQYQLLTAQLAIGDAYDSKEKAPDGVNEALEHIQTAMNLLGDTQQKLSEARPNDVGLPEATDVHSEMGQQHWEDVAGSEFVDIARSPIAGDLAFVFDHPGIGLHGFRWREGSKTLESLVYNRVEDDDE